MQEIVSFIAFPGVKTALHRRHGICKTPRTLEPIPTRETSGGDRHHPGDRRPDARVRRLRRRRRRRSARRDRHDPCPDRPERRRQDDLLQPADLLPAADARHDHVQGPRHHRHEAGDGRAAGADPQLPDLGGVPASDRAGERPPGAAAGPRRQLRLLAVREGAEGLRRPRARAAVRCRAVRRSPKPWSPTCPTA